MANTTVAATPAHAAQRILAACMVTWLACGAPCALAQNAATRPAVRDFKLGALEISVLLDQSGAVANDGSVFGLDATPADVAGVLRKAGVATGKIPLDDDAMLVRMPGHLVLIDTGNGPAGDGIMQQSLALAHVSPGDITDILITHSHPDHVGGLVDAQGHAAFPAATIRMSAAEWTFMQANAGSKAVVRAIRPQVRTFEPGHAILPGITPRALPGHTPGQVGYEIVSQGHTLMDVGDTVHSSIVSLARPDWTLGWDTDRKQGATTRIHELRQLATTHELMFAPHFPFPGVGRIERSGDGFRFQPAVPSDQ
ncbi:MAG TPA: MBL fold metallo-hydrolase [Rhodanobacteraceae bacterium]|nr:MBL fold metallo-hydrolase [Rhodanobacteraceae bacterium]